ncbi:MAG: hypothetical protein JXB45_01330 [Candidatus Krumholzibacteriota bacterium]|nr:hypothetical protein [Candidatus Krumholzibacteriota bacterium]
MNLGLFRRAISRHRYMRDRPAYRGFLEQINSHPGVWKTSQGIIALWWERRQRSSLRLEIVSPGILRVSSPLSDGAVEIEGKTLAVPPLELPVAKEIPPGELTLTYHCPVENAPFWEEVLGHLGYAHLAPARDGKADMPGGSFLPLLGRLRQRAEKHQNYDPHDLRELRELLAGMHRRRGLPDLRMWTLPQRGGKVCRVAVSTRYDVDKAIVNLPAIHELEASYGLRSTVYLRPLGVFYGAREIKRYAGKGAEAEIALHGEFVTTAAERFGDEFRAAREEKKRLEDIVEREVAGVCMHGGELRSNLSPLTHRAVEAAGFKYNTLYRNYYYHPLHLPREGSVDRTLCLGQHYADITAKHGPRFGDELLEAFWEKFTEAEKVGGVFVPVLHPLYFDLFRYLRDPGNLLRLSRFAPRYFLTLGRMKKDQRYSNQP